MTEITIERTEMFENGRPYLGAYIRLGENDYLLDSILIDEDSDTNEEQLDDIEVFIETWRIKSRSEKIVFTIDEEVSDLLSDLSIAIVEEAEKKAIDDEKAMKRSQN